MKRRASMSETALQAHLVRLLVAYGRHDIEWHAVPNGEKREKKTAWRLQLIGVKPGVADLMFLIDGVSIALELKTEIGRQSNDQSNWAECYERAGGKYFLAFGLDQALGVLSAISAFRPGVTFATHSSEVRAEA